MNAADIKELGSVWGSQHGLLSVAELELLMRLVRDYPGTNPSVLEVGHYMGLSTCGLVHALRGREDRDWRMTTLDSHQKDRWVHATNPHGFYRNRLAYFSDHRLDVAELVAAGWRDESPPLNRMPQDKRDPGTMTLGVMRR